MDAIILGWFVLELTHSPFLVGVVSALRFWGSALGPFFGVAADRYDRRRLLLLVQLITTLQMSSLLVLIWTEWIQVWHIFVLMFLGGVARAEWPLQQILIADLVREEDLANGVALINAASNVTSILGPALGGILLAKLGITWCYGLITTVSLLQMLTIYLIQMPSEIRKTSQRSIWQDIRAGIHYSYHQPAVLAALATAALVNFLGFPLTFSLMPIFARDVLHIGADGLGFLVAMVGAGALIGSLVVAGSGSFSLAGPLMIYGTLGWMGNMILFALLPWFIPALLVLALMGIAHGVAMANIVILILGNTSRDIRGRIMGLRSMVIGTLPIGSFLAGAATEFIGAPLTVIMSGLLGIVAVIAIAKKILYARKLNTHLRSNEEV
jgi:MFS family permease